MAEKKVKEYVAYTPLGGYKPGDVVNPANWSLEEWTYMVEHEVVVVKNSPNDPNVLAEQAEEKEVDEPDGRNAEQRRDDAATAAHKAATQSSTSQEEPKKAETSSEESKTAPEAPKTPTAAAKPTTQSTPKKEG